MFERMARHQYPATRQRPNQFRRPASQPKTGAKLDRFSTSLDTVQQVLGVVHSTAPYIEKYGPIVQKLPSIYRIYQAMKDIDVTKNTDEAQTEPVNKSESTTKRVRPNHTYPSPTLYI